MLPRQIRLMLLSTALAAAATLGVSPSASGQTAKEQKMAAASGQQPQGGSVRLRVGLVISEAVRSYRQTMFLSHFDFGKRFATQAEQVFEQTFIAVRPMLELPADPHANDGLDLIVVAESPEGSYHQSGFVTGTMTLAVRFTVRDTSGAQLFQVQESDTEKGSNANNILDRLGEAVSRKFVQDLLLNPRVQNILSPPPPVAAKPVLADSSMMDSAGLDVPPPPPWGPPAPASAAAPGSGGRP